MTDRIQFYTNPMSRGQIARWMLEEVGEPYDMHILDYASGMKAPDYLAINPMGKVPAIVHRGKVVTECAAICAYLADAFPAAGLAPAEDEKADYYRWFFFAAGPVEAAVSKQDGGLRDYARARAHVRLWQLRPRRRGADVCRDRPRSYLRQPLHRR